MEMFYLWLGLGSGVLIPQPYPSLEACKAAGDQVQQIYYHNSICIPAPIPIPNLPPYTPSKQFTGTK